MAEAITKDKNRDVDYGGTPWARWLIGVIGVVFLLAGIWGFFAPTLYGLFPSGMTATHNWVHVLTGLLYTYLGFAPASLDAVAWVSRVGGIVYALLGVVGFVAPTLFAPFLVLGFNENVFHLVIGIVIATLGFLIPTGEAVVERAHRPTV